MVHLLEERKDMAALQLPADQYLAGGINSVHLEDRLAMSNPIVVTVWMDKVCEPQWRPHPWRSTWPVEEQSTA